MVGTGTASLIMPFEAVWCHNINGVNTVPPHTEFSSTVRLQILTATINRHVLEANTVNTLFCVGF